MKLKHILVFFGAFILLSCNRHRNTAGNTDVVEAADSFAIHYFNWHFEKAAKFATEESRLWLSYAASQVQQEDLDILRDKPDATVIAENVEMSDSAICVIMTVHDFLQMDTIGTEAHRVEKARFRLPVVRLWENGKQVWKVRMEGLPRSEKQNHD